MICSAKCPVCVHSKWVCDQALLISSRIVRMQQSDGLACVMDQQVVSESLCHNEMQPVSRAALRVPGTVLPVQLSVSTTAMVVVREHYPVPGLTLPHGTQLWRHCQCRDS
jgi:hypothetical protein